MKTIHRPQSMDLVEIQRVFELVQRDRTATNALAVTAVNVVNGGSVAGASGSGSTGPAGPAGPPGTANIDLLVVSLTEEEDIIVLDNGDMISDENGYLVTDIHTGWALVTDENGSILTAE